MKMKRFGILKIGGIQSKVFGLSLMTIILLTIAFVGITVYQGSMIRQMFNDFSQKEQTVVRETTGEVMDQVIRQNVERANRTEAGFTDELFMEAKNTVTHLADCLTELFADPDGYIPKPYEIANPDDDGIWKAKVVFAAETDRDDPALTDKLGLVANLSNTMVSLCLSFGVEHIYIGLPEGALYTASDFSSTWFEDGKMLDFDPKRRLWYKDAVQEGGLIFTDGEWDFSTGKYCVECAAPVYDSEGKLQAVVGMDLFLDRIKQVLQDSSVEGEYSLLINQDGNAVLPMQAEVFPMPSEDRDKDLRECGNEFLSQAVRNALNGENMEVTLAQLNGENCYIIATPIEMTGWVLLSAYSQAAVDDSAVLLNNRLSTVQNDAMTAYGEKVAHSQIPAVVMLIAVVLLMLGGAVVVGSRIVKPLNLISRRISELRDDNLEFRMEDTYRTGDEVEELAESFAAVSHRTVEYMDKVVKVTAEKERISTELGLAAQIQADALPNVFPAFPEHEEISIFAGMTPAKEVGGDFYDFFLIDETHLGIVMADVSDKGVPAALFMMSAKSLIRTYAKTETSPAQVMQAVNDRLCENNRHHMFVTVWFGILDLSTGRITAVNAGHEYPALMPSGGCFDLFRGRSGFVVGGMAGMRYRELEIDLMPGAKIFLYTDGVPEAHNAAGEMFGMERMIASLNTDPKADPQILLKNMRKAVDEFVKDAEQFDDLTMLCVEYKGKSREDKRTEDYEHKKDRANTNQV